MGIIQTATQATLCIAQSTVGRQQLLSTAATSPLAESPAATFEASSDCVVADQQRALKNLRVGAASADWSVAFAGDTQPTTTSQPILGRPNNWRHLKQQLATYLERSENRSGGQHFPCKSKGFIDLDRSGDPGSATGVIKNNLPPGCFTVSIHGVAPVIRSTGEVNPGRNSRPFWDGVEPTIWNRSLGLQTTNHVVGKIEEHLDQADDAPIFLNSCNAGTESEGYIPAADVAKQTGRYVIAPANSRILGDGRGPQLTDQGGEWLVFRPDGTTESLYKPKTYAQPRKANH